jgi:transposase-like protein
MPRIRNWLVTYDCPKCNEDRLWVVEAIPGKRHGYLCKGCGQEYGANFGRNMVNGKFVQLATLGDDVWIVEEVDEDPADNS